MTTLTQNINGLLEERDKLLEERSKLREYVAAYKDRLQYLEPHYNAALRDIAKLRAELVEARKVVNASASDEASAYLEKHPEQL